MVQTISYRTCLLTIILFFFCTVSTSFGKDAIRIGVVGAMKIDSGEEMWNGALMAAEEINNHGGIQVGPQRMKIRLIKADSNEFLNVDYATNTMEMLLLQNMVDFVVGGFQNEATLAMQDVAMDYHKVFFSIGATSPELCRRVGRNYDRYKYYFRGGTLNSKHLCRVCFQQLNQIAQILREKLGVKTIKVAIATEENSWVDSMVEQAQKTLPKMGLKLVGTFQFSAADEDISTNIIGISQTHAPLVLALFASEAGISFVTQAFDFKLPAMIMGLNLEAQKSDFWKKTNGKANYTITLAPFVPGVEISNQTKTFMDKYSQRFGEMPGYMAGGTYASIAGTLAPAIEQAGTLNPERLVNTIENNVYTTPQGVWAYDKDEKGHHLHDLKFGAKYAMVLGAQWLDGKMEGIWPNKYIEKKGAKPLSYKGIVDVKIPPIVIKTYKQQ
jgi:branched-chain amino acid transport system substrate-binding protein